MDDCRGPGPGRPCRCRHCNALMGVLLVLALVIGLGVLAVQAARGDRPAAASRRR